MHLHLSFNDIGVCYSMLFQNAVWAGRASLSLPQLLLNHQHLQEDAWCSAGRPLMSDEEINALPDSSDVEGDSEYDVYFEQDWDIWSVTTWKQKQEGDEE